MALSGFKAVARSESDRMVVWGGVDVQTGWREGRGDAGVGEGEWGARLDGRRRVVWDK